MGAGRQRPQSLHIIDQEEDGSIATDLKVWKSDLTKEGFEFYSRSHDKFFDAIDRGKAPTDISILERELKKLREG